MNGKGSKPRNLSKKFRDNYGEINWSKRPVCPSCKNEIDPDVCHCGEDKKNHRAEHGFVPIGCDCFRAKPSNNTQAKSVIYNCGCSASGDNIATFCPIHNDKIICVAAEAPDKDVHTEHCCIKHGCKYRDEDCPVANGQKPASFDCEDCNAPRKRI